MVEQACRAVAVMSEPSFTSRTRLFVEKIQFAIHKVQQYAKPKSELRILLVYCFKNAGFPWISSFWERFTHWTDHHLHNRFPLDDLDLSGQIYS